MARRKRRRGLRDLPSSLRKPYYCAPIDIKEKLQHSYRGQKRYDFVATMETERDSVGVAELLLGEDQALVSFIEVSPKKERCGIGTRLYEAMLAFACAHNAKLASDTSRTEKSEGFWRKQVAKGRATCVEPQRKGRRLSAKFSEAGTWDCRQYQMNETCPVGGLAGRKRRRRR